MPEKRNCYTCRYLEWLHAVDPVDRGFTCNKPRGDTPKDRALHQVLLQKIAREDYRRLYKRCYQPIINQSKAKK